MIYNKEYDEWPGVLWVLEEFVSGEEFSLRLSGREPLSTLQGSWLPEQKGPGIYPSYFPLSLLWFLPGLNSTSAGNYCKEMKKGIDVVVSSL